MPVLTDEIIDRFTAYSRLLIKANADMIQVVAVGAKEDQHSCISITITLILKDGRKTFTTFVATDVTLKTAYFPELVLAQGLRNFQKTRHSWLRIPGIKEH